MGLPVLLTLLVVSWCQLLSASQFSGPVNDFSVSLFRELATENGQKNVFVSPLSVSTALSMLLLGARTSTADQLKKGLHFAGIKETNGRSIHFMFSDDIDSVVRNGSSVSIANYLLVQKEPVRNMVLERYVYEAESLYHADVDDVNFGTDGHKIMERINNWVTRSTKGLIRSILNAPPSADSAAVILNAIYFKGTWERQFRKQHNLQMNFFNHGQNGKATEFMTQTEKSFPYKEVRIGDEAVQALEMPYEEDSMSMFVLLPRKRNGLQTILSSAGVDSQLSSAIRSLRHINHTEVNIFMPKFKFETEYSLNSALNAMGISNIFTRGADLSGINGRRDLHVSQVKHKAIVRVDEVGTEAAAVTSIEIAPTSVRNPDEVTEFRADHPFLFIIMNKETGIILFMGKVEEL